MATAADRPSRRADALSRERVVTAAVEILDAEGESGLTFRTLAKRLSTGAGAIYWHVQGKDELLAAAANTVIAVAIGGVRTRGKPAARLRAVALALFDAFEAHPWAGAQLARDPSRLAGARILEAVGGTLDALAVAPESQFAVASALADYIAGAAGLSAAHAAGPPGLDRTAFLEAAAQRWERLDPAEFPFVHRILRQVPDHDDREQFASGIDLILAGIEKRNSPRISPARPARA
ncbi:MAG: TetR family transcriptional regulator [Propionibacteriaceae bacterium]|jgi:AcrR family transcriptional regulator|nr:TetR family transcriptional regulator [Propionibacteriaceae bacterium]